MRYIAHIRHVLHLARAVARRPQPGVRREASRSLAVYLALVACVILLVTPFPATSRAGVSAAFGPQRYVREKGQPTPVTKTFSVSNPSATFTMRLESSGVSSAVVTLNGVDVFKPSDFNSKAQVLLKPVTLRSANTLTVELRGKPGESLTIQITGEDRDDRPPTITAAVSPEPNAAGWNNSDPVITFTCSDESGVASCTGAVLVTTETAGQVVVGTAVDNAGNTATTSVTIKLDKTPPAIARTVAPEPNAAGWNNSDTTVTFACSDGLSGAVFCTAPVSITSETGGQVVTATSEDRAGNTASAAVTVKLDKTPPSLQVNPPAGGSNVFISPVGLSGTVSDALSGLASLTCQGLPAAVDGDAFNCSVPLTPGGNSISTVAADLAGNSRTSTLSLSYTRTPVVTITSPTNLSYHNISPTTVTGTVDDPAATVTVNSVQAVAVNGAFSVALPLAEGPNIITASATSASGAVGTASIEVTLDITPPRVTVTSPPDQFVTTEASVSVAGSVNDIVVGTVNAEQARVSVNGAEAQVANRTFLATAVPLSIGPNVIQAVGRDRVGNAATSQITVTRQAPAQAQIRPVSGNNQTWSIGSVLPSPLVVAVTDSSGNPVAGKPVVFKVTQNDGKLAAGGPPAVTVIATTDAQGQAQVLWKLGMRAGAGGNTAEAYAVGFDGTAIFNATGTQGPAGNIVIDTGNDQTGAVGQPLPKPLIAVVVDTGNNRLAGVPVTFTVKGGGGSFGGQPTFTVETDSDGRAAATLTLGSQEGNSNNLVQADFPLNTSFPASFNASGRAPRDPANTTVSGVVLDNSNVPIPGVTVRAVLTQQLNSNSSIVPSLTAVQTDAQGQFTIPQAPVGFVELMVDGSTAQRPGVYPTLEYDIVTVAGRDNTVGMPIYLLPLNPDNKLCVTATTGGGTLTIPEAPGFSLSFGPGQVTFPGGSKEGCISATVVHGDKVPMVPGFGQQPRFIVTIQPSGALFTQPARITLPNVDGLRPRAITEMYSFDHDIGSFVAIGTGTVSDDGRVIRSNPGVGVLKAGWHCGGDPNTAGSVASLSLSASPATLTGVKDDTFSVTANGAPPLDGVYSWELVATQPGDDVGIVQLTSAPTCADQESCVAQLKALKGGKATLRVRFRCTTTGQEATPVDIRISILGFEGVLTARDNFAGRSTTRFGLSEIIDLSFTSNPPATAASYGGLQWRLISGGGTLTAGVDGLGTYTAPATAATVVLRLEVASGPSQGTGKDYTITIIPPSGAHMTLVSGIRHTTGLAGVGFRGDVFLEPADVSFANLTFREGSVAGVGSGFYARHNGIIHATTATPVTIGGCNTTTGCRINGTDTVDTGDDGPPFSIGDFLWAIPWQYRAGSGAFTSFTTANHHQTANAVGRTTIEKAGAGPFAKNAADPTSSY